jgi:hypothetical protein
MLTMFQAVHQIMAYKTGWSEGFLSPLRSFEVSTSLVEHSGGSEDGSNMFSATIRDGHSKGLGLPLFPQHSGPGTPVFTTRMEGSKEDESC